MNLAKRKKRRKNNFLFKRGKLQLSGVISLVLVLGMLIVLFAQLVPRLSFSNSTPAPNLSTVNHQKFIRTMAPYAKTMQKRYGVLPSITIAQAILESDWGTSQLSKDYNNYFGIKGTVYQTTKEMKTQEFVNGKWITVTARFRVYNSWKDSVKDHTLLFVNGTNWNKDQYKAVRTAINYKTAAQALYTAGYATDPNYPAKLIDLIQTYNLEQYDAQ